MVGMQVVVTRLRRQRQRGPGRPESQVRATQRQAGRVMITYPSTTACSNQVKELCALVHRHGGRTYVDGANMNALVGVAAPASLAAT